MQETLTFPPNNSWQQSLSSRTILSDVVLILHHVSREGVLIFHQVPIEHANGVTVLNTVPTKRHFFVHRFFIVNENITTASGKTKPNHPVRLLYPLPQHRHAFLSPNLHLYPLFRVHRHHRQLHPHRPRRSRRRL